jgi:predicted acylesterase/phospholipase RssA
MDLSGGINGVFKGGGARGVVYAGALRAVEERGIEFKAVAGSSAGAITAALIAARMSARELAKSSTGGLKSLRKRIFGGFLPWVGKSLFSVDRLEEWLEQQLRVTVRAHTGSEPQKPVTFEQLFEATHIELNVVAMDLARKQPVVFNHQTAPECAVAAAVVASCAIPVAMPAGRVTIRGLDGTERVHRIVDGGAWANYPAFVFRDPSFRQFHGLDPLPPERPTVGFVINDPSSGDLPRPEDPIQMESRSRRHDDLGSGTASGLIGSLLNWRPMRYGAFVLVPIIIGLVFLAWLQSQLSRFVPVVGALPNTLEPFAVVALVFLLVIVAAITIVLAVSTYRLGRELFDVGLPSALAALSVGPGVPDWVGRSDSDPVVRLSAPLGITTTGFKIEDNVRRHAIACAYEETMRQLDDIERFGWVPPAAPKMQAIAASGNGQTGREQRTPWYRPSDRFWLGLGLLFLFAGGSQFAIILARGILSGRNFPGVALFGGMLVAGSLMLLGFAARIRGERVRKPPTARQGTLWARTVATALLFGGLTLLMFTVDVGSLSRFASADRVGATVSRIVGETETKEIYDVDVDRPVPRLAGGTFTRYCGSRGEATCLRFESLLATLNPGDRTEVLHLSESGEAFLAGEEWQNDALITAAVNVGVWLALGVILLWGIEDIMRLRRARSVRKQAYRD